MLKRFSLAVAFISLIFFSAAGLARAVFAVINSAGSRGDAWLHQD